MFESTKSHKVIALTPTLNVYIPLQKKQANKQKHPTYIWDNFYKMQLQALVLSIFLF